MGAGHAHGHGVPSAGPASGRHRTRLVAVFALVAAFFVVELVYGVLASSLALLSDAGHMAADVVTLGAALAATKIATRPDASGRRTFGSYRAEVFASGFAVLVMLGVAAYVVVEALGRAGDAVDVQTTPMIVVGALGLVVNAVSIVLLRAGAGESLLVRGAYLEVVADTAGSVGVVVAGVLVAVTGDAGWDTAVALAIGAFVAVRAVLLGRQVLAVLGQHVPEGCDVDALAADLAAVDGVTDVHDLHVWVLTSGMNVATAHLVAGPGADLDGILAASRGVLRDRHDVEHATLQVEGARAPECHSVDW